MKPEKAILHKFLSNKNMEGKIPNKTAGLDMIEKLAIRDHERMKRRQKEIDEFGIRIL